MDLRACLRALVCNRASPLLLPRLQGRHCRLRRLLLNSSGVLPAGTAAHQQVDGLLQCSGDHGAKHEVDTICPRGQPGSWVAVRARDTIRWYGLWLSCLSRSDHCSGVANGCAHHWGVLLGFPIPREVLDPESSAVAILPRCLCGPVPCFRGLCSLRLLQREHKTEVARVLQSCGSSDVVARLGFLADVFHRPPGKNAWRS
mmetsp:Transcript_85611/g.239085  ORF Transcript_85611/g.239085 Transcript_85611/m.239085 type:complete len:201 (-) Transcript_85611:740-1342(-)